MGWIFSKPKSFPYLKVLRERGDLLDVKVVSLVGRGRLGEGPELVLVELGAQQGGHHRQGSSEGPVSLGVDQQLVSQSCSVTRPCHHNSQETAQIRHHLRDLHKDSPLLGVSSPLGLHSFIITP